MSTMSDLTIEEYVSGHCRMRSPPIFSPIPLKKREISIEDMMKYGNVAFGDKDQMWKAILRFYWKELLFGIGLSVVFFIKCII